MGRKAILLAVATVGMLLATSGVALAATTVSGHPDAGTVQTDGRVTAIVANGGKVYLAGYFTHVDGVPRNHLAAVDATTGQLASWDPNANGAVQALAVSSDGTRLYAGGPFTSVNGASRPYLAALDPATGALSGGWTNPTTPNGTVFDLQESAGRLYSAEGGPGGALTAYDPSTGGSLWT
jgi:hypothetical protein